jgi:uncharacterized membrane protein HdeD (DUF308 family)/pimeloyl-ACP methyl ester carboxylesterase
VSKYASVWWGWAVRNLAERRWPWWLVGLLGAACVLVGAVLVAARFGSLKTLVIWVAVGLVVIGSAQLLTARTWWSRLLGLAWIITGVAAVFVPGLTLRATALIIGIALLVGGVVKLVSAIQATSDDRLVASLTGTAAVVAGVLALAWQDATILILSILFGFATILFGFGQIVRALRLRRTPPGGRPAPYRWPRWLRITAASAALLLAVGGVAVSVRLNRAVPTPTAFYTAPTTLPDGLGSIVRSEIVAGFTPGATTYRVLYTSTGYDGERTAVSGLIFVPVGEPPTRPRDIVSFTHGTVGIAVNCAPSALPSVAGTRVFEGLDLFLAAGYIVTATDYQGLGTPGPHPYLVGLSAAHNALDLVRAAGQLPDAHAGTRYVTWGHSQGGHSSLFTGQTAAGYAPELRLVGVAAGAPPSDLPGLLEVNMKTLPGKALIAMLVKSWSDVYDISLNGVVLPSARPAIDKIAKYCLFKQFLAAVPSSLMLGVAFLGDSPAGTEPWKTLFVTNAPGNQPIGVPVLLTQGDADTIIDPALTTKLAGRLCERGERVQLRSYPGVGHPDAGFIAAPDAAGWIADRFAGEPAPTTCG